MQQELARPGKLERFLDDPEHVRAVRKIFTGLYSLDQVNIKRISLLTKKAKFLDMFMQHTGDFKRYFWYQKRAKIRGFHKNLLLTS